MWLAIIERKLQYCLTEMLALGLQHIWRTALWIPGPTVVAWLTESVAAIMSEQCGTVWGEWGHKQWV